MKRNKRQLREDQKRILKLKSELTWHLHGVRKKGPFTVFRVKAIDYWPGSDKKMKRALKALSKIKISPDVFTAPDLDLFPKREGVAIRMLGRITS